MRRSQALPTVPGTYLLVNAHDDECKAPVLDCTCTPDVHFVPAPSAAAARIALEDTRRRHAIRNALD